MEENVNTNERAIPVREYEVPDNLVVKITPPKLWMKKHGIEPGDFIDVFQTDNGHLIVKKRTAGVTSEK